ncbi:MAG: flagellar FliJ family protein [Calditrichia bacterium]
MKRYKFRLESIQKLRERTVRMRQVERANAQALLMQHEDILKKSLQEKELYLSKTQQSRKNKTFFTAVQLQQLSGDLSVLDQKISEQLEVVKDQKERLKEIEHQLLEEEKERKIIEELRQKDYDDFREQQKRKVAEETDFIAERLIERKREWEEN